MKCTYAILVLNLLLISCGSGGGDTEEFTEGPGITNTPEQEITDSILPRNNVREIDELYAYRRDSEYADVISDCMLIEDWRDGCTLDTLPFIAQADDTVTVEDIMDRVVVTHDWMGERFEQFLNEAPNLMIDLFGSVTSVRIGSTIRPSSYWTGTGAISIDPLYLWQTVEEKQTVAVDEDYRAGFGNGLIFWERRSWRIDGYPARTFHSLEDYSTRTASELEFNLYALMYHELAHAYDVLPRPEIYRLNSSMNSADALWDIRDGRLSDALTNDSPLLSDTLKEIGRVKYHGDDATEAQRSMDAYFIGAEMANDGAARMYSYSSTREDFANLFETVMMKDRFNANQYLAVVTTPEDPNNYSCSELTVSWGTRNRLSDPLVNSRAQRVMFSMLGGSQADDVLASIVAQVDDMTPGVDWCANRDEGLPAAALPADGDLTMEQIRAAEHRMLEIEAKQELNHQ